MSQIQLIKDHVDIVDLVEGYTELRGTGNRLRAKLNPLREGGDLDVYRDTQKFYDHGTGDNGDVIDFIQIVENLDKKDAIEFLQNKYLNGIDIKSTQVKPQPQPVKNNLLLLEQLTLKANRYLQAPAPIGVLNNNRFTYEKYSVVEVEGTETVRVIPFFEKLFEGILLPTDKKFATYLFNRVVGYDSYFNCPVIIIRDQNEIVVDIVRYRPSREGFNDLPKYLYTRSSEKPENNYIFPLQAQMEKLILDQDYCFVGEGLKNAINASMMGVPFISIEGAANIKPSLISFLKSESMKDITMVGAFDGDQAGEKAYKKMSAEIPMRNMFDFDSGMDLAEYLKGLRNE